MKFTPPPDHMLTDDDVAVFWEAVAHWQERLGLQDWRITQSMRPPAGAIAMVDKWDWKARQVRCRLNRNWKGEEPTTQALAATALHELLHVLLHHLIETAKDPRASDDDLASSEHAVINKLERLLGDV